MLSNCEKTMLLISSTTNEWPLNNQVDDQNLMASANISSEKATQEQQQQQQHLQALKCPRCDSSNTKFCYYNNYSLSQPRHFCKACKRYWTRGGTLRNVPVGGGCRKNKRAKRPPSLAAPGGVESSPSSSSVPMVTTNPNMNPMFYHGLNTNISFTDQLNLPLTRLSNNSRADMYDQYDLQPQMSSLGFSSSSQMMASDVTSKSLFSSYPLQNFVSLRNSSASNSPTMASLMATVSKLQQQKFVSNGAVGDHTQSGGTNFVGFSSYDHQNMQIQGSDSDGMVMNEVKSEECQNRLNHQIQQQIGSSSDPNNNTLFWNGNGVGSWLDPANISSSVPSLI